MGWFSSPAKKAGRKAGKAWQRILDHTSEEIEALTGVDLYTHARQEARSWLRSRHSITETTGRRIIYPGMPSEPTREYKEPEQRYHEEFLEYVEAFVAVFPTPTTGYPKEDEWG